METSSVLGETSDVSEQPVCTLLTPGLCLFHFFFAVVWLLWWAVALLIGIRSGDRGMILWNLILSIIYGPNVWVKWKQYQRVSSGMVVYARRAKIRMPAAASVVVFSLLTLLAIGATVFSAIFLQVPWLRIFTGDLLVFSEAAVVANVLLWGYVAYCWYRLSLESQRNKPQEILSVPTEGVWPPPIEKS